MKELGIGDRRINTAGHQAGGRRGGERRKESSQTNNIENHTKPVLVPTGHGRKAKLEGKRGKTKTKTKGHQVLRELKMEHSGKQGCQEGEGEQSIKKKQGVCATRPSRRKKKRCGERGLARRVKVVPWTCRGGGEMLHNPR